MPEQPDSISALIVERPMCLPCIAVRTRMQPEAVTIALEVLGRAFHIRRHSAKTCTECEASTTVYVLDIT